MMKKLGIGFLVIVFAFLAFVYVQKGKIEQKLTALLQDNRIQVAQSRVNWLPSPAIDLAGVTYLTEDMSFSAERVRLNFSWWGWLFGQSAIADLQLENGKVRSNLKENFYFQQINAVITPENLKLASLPALSAQYRQGSDFPEKMPELFINVAALNEQEDKLTFEGALRPISSGLRLNNVKATIQLKKRRLFNAEQILLNWKNGEILRLPQEGYIVNLAGAEFNHIALNEVNARIQTEPRLNAVVQFPFISDKGRLSANLESHSQSTRPEPYHLMISAQHLVLADWLKAFNIPDLISGDVSVEADLFSQDALPRHGMITGRVTEGKLKGVGLLALIGQYVPLNYDESELNNKHIETSFDVLETQFRWEPEGIRVDRTQMLHRDFTAKSQGYVDLIMGYCDFMTYISSNDERYRALTLPVHFFGDCKSPQYKVKFNRDFRNQLKDFLREKFR
ncbi:hypothetical protein P7L88_09855 [Bisgaard Taxon 10/6]|uniref:hypothetical protein n=1 Tax=Exercitatus varius TaxID=67857 RepID=UPI00294AAA5E|nr:hypothetical protein [Exercitatus varius]MDG2948820.1 hypothetical protein [Exercitatus varius]